MKYLQSAPKNWEQIITTAKLKMTEENREQFDIEMKSILEYRQKNQSEEMALQDLALFRIHLYQTRRMTGIQPMILNGSDADEMRAGGFVKIDDSFNVPKDKIRTSEKPLETLAEKPEKTTFQPELI